ncbi:MAG TPA: RdgB/HAM1 family non-canonical purine NTP pyrophosphatase [Deinococcales bacterium]|nr:RdgB/HAM1 family non-canonical purine NTP pyrophosphatase [Deinococcales bacterium]
MRVLVATGNPGKVVEFREALERLGWDLVGLDGLDLTLPEETGTTYEENAALKAAFVATKTGLPALADDSGLEVEALSGEPGVYSARYGNRSSDLERNLLLLDNLRLTPAPRRAKFVSVVALAFPNGDLREYRGEAEGEILQGPRGEGGFGYDPLFLYPPLGKTFAELTVEEKRRVSHRGQALQALAEAFANERPDEVGVVEWEDD